MAQQVKDPALSVLQLCLLLWLWQSYNLWSRNFCMLGVWKKKKKKKEEEEEEEELKLKILKENMSIDS